LLLLLLLFLLLLLLILVFFSFVFLQFTPSSSPHLLPNQSLILIDVVFLTDLILFILIFLVHCRCPPPQLLFIGDFSWFPYPQFPFSPPFSHPSSVFTIFHPSSSSHWYAKMPRFPAAPRVPCLWLSTRFSAPSSPVSGAGGCRPPSASVPVCSVPDAPVHLHQKTSLRLVHLHSWWFHTAGYIPGSDHPEGFLRDRCTTIPTFLRRELFCSAQF